VLSEAEQELLKEPAAKKEEDNKKPAPGQVKKPPVKELRSSQAGKAGSSSSCET
jgi:hypothetical protein